MGTEKTVIVSFDGIAKGADWVVYRVRTQNGQYAVGIHEGIKGRKLAVLTNVRFVKSAEDMRESQDSAPLVGDRSLFSVPYREWIGEPLSIGAIRTSPIVAIDPETDPYIVEEVSRVTMAKIVMNPVPERSPYPRREVELAEAASHILHRLYDRTDLFRDVKSDEELERRLRTSLETCTLMLRALSERARH
jgi:hypothetical protein